MPIENGRPCSKAVQISGKGADFNKNVKSADKKHMHL